jgi:phosphoglucosamine mutase
MRRLFGTDGIRGKANEYPMTPELMLSLGKAIALYFSKKNNPPKIVIGKDTRVSGYMIETAITSGMVSMGATVLLIGPMPTPAISHLTRSFNADAGIMISASHNPAEDNGIKIFDSKGYKLSDDEEHEIEDIIFSEKIVGKESSNIGKAYRVDDAKGRYIEFAKSSIKDFSLSGIKIVVDCANGAAYSVAPKIFSELGASVIAINNQPNGYNINLNCGATNIEKLSKIVVTEKADIGIALDGDADRVVVVDSHGKEINGDNLIARLAIELKSKGKLSKDTVVTTVMSNSSFENFLNKNGISVVRTKVGDRYVIDEMRKGGFNFGGEQSGHIIFGDYSTTGDGIITSLQLLRLMKSSGKSVSSLLQIFKHYPQVLHNVEVKEKKPIEQLEKTSKILSVVEKALKDKGRVLIRYSGTENICRIMVEGKNLRQVKLFAARLAKAVKEEIGK